VRYAYLTVRTDALQQREVLLFPIESGFHAIPPLLHTVDETAVLPQLDANRHGQLIGLVPGNIVRTEPSGLRIYGVDVRRQSRGSVHTNVSRASEHVPDVAILLDDSCQVSGAGESPKIGSVEELALTCGDARELMDARVPNVDSRRVRAFCGNTVTRHES